MNGLALWRESNQEQSNRGNDQHDLPDHREECDERVATEQQKIQPGRQYGTRRQRSERNDRGGCLLYTSPSPRDRG